MTPDISIIVPVYNVEPYIRQCVDSILAQTHENFELILVDDGSPDNCPSICDEYAARDERISVIHKENGGLVSAWKTGLRAATAELVGFVDSDDWIDPGFYEDLYRACRETGADIVVGEYASEMEDGSSVPVSRRKTLVYSGREEIRRLYGLLFTNYLYIGKPDFPMTNNRWDKLYRRELLVRNMELFDERLSLAEDLMTNAAVLPDCEKVVLLSGAAKYHYRVLTGSMCHDLYAEKPLRNLTAIHETLSDITARKGFNPDLARGYVGKMVYGRVYLISALPDMSAGEKKSRLKEIKRIVPKGALPAYARTRGGLFIRLFCGLFEAGFITPCMWIVRLHSAVTG